MRWEDFFLQTDFRKEMKNENKKKINNYDSVMQILKNRKAIMKKLLLSPAFLGSLDLEETEIPTVIQVQYLKERL